MDRAENVVMVRTFSKMGIAAERVGWMYGPEHVIDAVNRIRGPFNVSLSGQAAAAAAARDVEFTAQLLQLVHGRTDPRLRVRGTFAALRELVDHGYVGRSDGAELADDYPALARYMAMISDDIDMLTEIKVCFLA